MAALMKIGSIFVYTHDSIGLGEDGPTHQSIEHAATLRLIPGMEVWRPCDTIETAMAWMAAIERRDGPTALLLSRQNLPFVARSDQQLALDPTRWVCAVRGRGRRAQGRADRHRLGSGLGAGVAEGARRAKALRRGWCRCRAPSLFDAQEQSYRDAVLPRGVPARGDRSRRDRLLAQVRRPRRRRGGHRPVRRVGAGRRSVQVLRLHGRRMWSTP